MAEAMNITCIDAPADVEELTLTALRTAPPSNLKTPCIEQSPVAFECVLHANVPLGANEFIAIGRIVQAHVADEFVLDGAKQGLRYTSRCHKLKSSLRARRVRSPADAHKAR
jgi:flavin reductase (DIM6/NTAB) family NADH-FMN oxidoreductase RutF